MDPKIWGPSFWFILHTISMNYPENPTPEQKRRYYEFYDSLKHILPCTSCKEHYKQNLEKLPLTPYLDTKKSLISWVIMLHNRVNKMTKQREMSYEDVSNKYNGIYSRGYLKCSDLISHEKKESNNNVKQRKWNKWLIIIFIILLLLYFGRDIVNNVKNITQ
jgi:hypothetical protein